MKQRFLYDQLVGHLASKKHTIVVGPRQTGKTTLLKQLRDYCNQAQWPTVFLDLEHKDVRAELDRNPENVFLYCPAVEQRVYVFIDEIQKLSDPSNFLKQLYDDYDDGTRLKIIATGSSAFYIDEKFNDSLAGRKKVFRLYTCSFGEYLLLSGKDDLLAEVGRLKAEPTAKSLMLQLDSARVLEYMRSGGYPEVITETSEAEKIELLKDLRDSL